VDIQIGEIAIPLAQPFKTALRTVCAVHDVLIKIITDTEHEGYGEAPPTAAVTGETNTSVIAAICEYIKPAIVGMEIENLEAVLRRLNGAIEKNTSAKAAVDMALYDLFAKRHEIPLYRLLGGFRSAVKTDITISLNSAEEMARDSLAAVAAGYDTLKLKAGKNIEKDLHSVFAVRKAVGKTIILRIDANQGWTPKEAVRTIRRLEDMDLNIELVEQPVRATDLAGLRFVTKNVQTPILADESVFSAGDALKIIQTGAADMINIKLMKTGGIYEALKICALAETNGIDCMMGCMLEGHISCAAAAHLACAKGVLTKTDIDGPGLCAASPFHGGPRFSGADIRMNKTPGLGFENLSDVPVVWH
jgi:o-succinylbenzoate synthase